MIEKIIQKVAEVYDVKPELIKGKSRKAPLPEARRMTIYFSKDLNQPNDNIMSVLGINENYVNRACRKTKDELFIYSKVAVIMERIRLKLEQLQIK